MTLKLWGPREVSSALEVFLVLVSPPADPQERAEWKDLLTIGPPFWGSLIETAPAVAALHARRYVVWSWDDHGVVLSPADAEPPRGLRYRTRDALRHEQDDPPTHPRPSASADA